MLFILLFCSLCTCFLIFIANSIGDVTVTSIATSIINFQVDTGSFTKIIVKNINLEPVCEITRADRLNDCSDSIASPGPTKYTISGETAGLLVNETISVTNIQNNSALLFL